MTEPSPPGPGPRAGTVALIGRPNAGKSTLMNRFLTEKLAIVSNKPQTTRQRLVGIVTGERGQMVFFDTPGVHKPKFEMNRHMVKSAVDSLGDSDVVCLVVDASHSFGAGDKYLIELLEGVEIPCLVALNKIDRMAKERLLPEIERYHETGQFEEIVPISALDGDGTDRLLDLLWERLPVGPPLYDAELLTTHTERFLVAERIREKILEQTREELPFASAVLIRSWEGEGDDGLLRIAADLLVERPGQKKILIGKGGSQIKSIGIAARKDLEEYLDRRVHLDLHVREQPRWREDPRILAELERGSVAWGDL